MSGAISFSPDEHIRCAGCGESFNPELYVIVDTSERPDLVELIKKGTLHSAVCPHCNVILQFVMPLLVYRPGETVPVIYSPVPGASESQQEQYEDMIFHIFRERLGESWDDGLANHIYMVGRADLSSVVDLNLDLTPDGSNFQSMRNALDRYMSCATWEESLAAVESYDILLTREAEFTLRKGLARLRAVSDQDAVSMVEQHLALLQECRLHGVREAFASKCDGTGHTVKANLIAIYRELARLSDQPDRAVELARAGLRLLERKGNEEKWADLQGTLGDGLLYAARRGQISETDDAAWHYRTALEFYNRERSMREWVRLSWQLLEIVKITPSYPTVPQLVLAIMCRAEEPDRRREVVEAIWSAVWSKLRGDSAPPPADAAVEALVADGMISVENADARYDVASWVVASVSSGLLPATGQIIDWALAAYWLEDLPLRDAVRKGEAKLRVVAGILSAAPYLARAQEWDLLHTYLRVLLPLDHSAATVEKVLKYQRAITEATGRTNDDLTALERALTGIKSHDAIPMLSEEFNRYRVAGDFREALVTGLSLAGMLARTGHAREAYGITEELSRLAAEQEHVGAWSMLAIEVQKLQVLLHLDRAGEVLDRATALRKQLTEPAMRDADDPDEFMVPYEVRENLFDVGVDAANDLHRWRDSLDFSDDLLASRQARGATDYELATAQHDRYIPLLALGELDAAETVLLFCMEVYEHEGDSVNLAAVTGALGKVARARGLNQRAIELQLETLKHAYRRPNRSIVATAHRHFAEYLPEEDAGARLAHGLVAALVYRFAGDEGEFRATVREIADRRPEPGLLRAATPGWVAGVIGELDGVDLAVLEAGIGMDRAVVATSLAEILTLLGQDKPEDAAWRDSLAGRWEPAIAATVAAVDGDHDSAATLSQHLDIRELAPEWSRLVSALRLIISGQRDPSALLAALDETDAAIITRTLDALTGGIQLRASPAELPAVTDYALQRHRGLLDMMVAAARGRQEARQDVREWAGFIDQELGQEQLTTAVFAVLDGAREPGPLFDALTPSQLRLIRAITEAIDANEPDPDDGHTAGAALNAALANPIGPPSEAVSTVVNNGADLQQALAAIEQGISRRLAARDTAVALQILELVITVLLSRYDIRNALPMAELLAGIPAENTTVPIRPELIELVCLTALGEAESIRPDSFLSLVGSAVPRQTPAPLGSLPAPAAVKQARRWLTVARVLRPLAPNKRGETALTLAEAMVSRASGDTGDAIERARAALNMATDPDISEPGFTGKAAMVLADAYTRRGELRRALELYDRGLAAEWSSAPLKRAEILINRAGIFDSLGQPRQAIADLHQADELLESADDLQTALMRGPVYDRLGGLYELLGELPAAAGAYERALRLAQSAGHKTGEASTLMALGELFGKLSTGYLRAFATEELEETLRVLLRIDPALAYMPTREGTRTIAITLLRRAADMFKAANNQLGWSHAANGLSNLMPEEQSEEAVGLLNEILRVKEEGGDRLGQAVSLANLAGRLTTLDRLDEAEDALRRSLDISRAAGYFVSAVPSATVFGMHRLSRGDLSEAETAFKGAVDMIEAARPHVPAGDRSRVTFTHHRADAYAGLVECLLARSAHEEAFNVVQQAKSRALLELVATADLRPTTPAEGRFAQLLAAEAEHLAVIRVGHARADTTGPAQDALDMVYDEMAAYDAEYVSMRRGTPATVASVRGWLNRQQRPVLLAEYFIGVTGLTIFLLRAEWDTVQVHTNSITSDHIRRGYADFHRQVVQYRDRGGAGWMALSAQLTEPLLPYLESDDLVVLVPHGMLHALPVHALPIGGVPLVSSHPVAYTPTCGLLPLWQSPAKGTGELNSCAAFGVTYETEAEAVSAIFGDHPIPAAGLSADTIAAQAVQRDIAHFSCHAYFNETDPLGSGLYLQPGEPGNEPDPADVLTARQIMNMHLHNELVTISGCETGLHAAMDGDELIGLTRAFLHAGTPSIVASLWPVDADATREIMVRFYTHLRDQYARHAIIDKADALRKAQLDIIEMKGIEASYYWAPFILIGDWS
jgi:tetratricopeptide (TPR) repeat protein